METYFGGSLENILAGSLQGGWERGWAMLEGSCVGYGGWEENGCGQSLIFEYYAFCPHL